MFSPFAKHRSMMTIALAIVAVFGVAAQKPPAPDDNAGFEAIFDGKTLTNWDGEPGYWRVENGTIVGETTPEKVLKVNTFLVWRGGTVKDFELKAEFRLTPSANSGIQYRSAILPEVSKWAMKGYQADMDGANTYTGMVYEERARAFLAPRGQFTRMFGGHLLEQMNLASRTIDVRTLKLIASLGEPDALKAFIKTGSEWNQIHVIAKGNTLMHFINGHLMAAFNDEDPQGRSMEGLLGLQLHTGQPMKNEFRNIYYKKL